MKNLGGHMPESCWLCFSQQWKDSLLCLGAIISAFLSCTASASTDARELSLQEAETFALQGEPGLLATKAAGAALTAQSAAARSLPVPQLRVGLQNFPLESGGFRTEGMTHAGVSFRQVFPPRRARMLSGQKLTLQATLADLYGELREREIIHNTRLAWLSAYHWQQSSTLISAARPFFEDLAQVTESLYSVGGKNQQDLLRAQLELSRLDSRLISIEGKRMQATAGLRQWVGSRLINRVSSRLPTWPALPTLGVMEDLLTQHPSLRAASQQIEIERYGARIAQSAKRPEWSMELGYSYRDGRLPNGQPRSDFVSLGVTMGLPSLRKQPLNQLLAAALEGQYAAEHERNRLQRELMAQLGVKHARWADLDARLKLFETDILTQSRANAEAALLAYQSDSADFAEVMRAYIDDLDIRLEHLRLQVAQAQTFADLAKLTGSHHE